MATGTHPVSRMSTTRPWRTEAPGVTLTTMTTGVSEQVDCWCCDVPVEADRAVRLGDHPEVVVCTRCAHSLHVRAGEVEDRSRTRAPRLALVRGFAGFAVGSFATGGIASPCSEAICAGSAGGCPDLSSEGLLILAGVRSVRGPGVDAGSSRDGARKGSIPGIAEGRAGGSARFAPDRRPPAARRTAGPQNCSNG